MGQDSVTGAGLGSEPNNQGTKWYARSVGVRRRDELCGDC